MKKFDRDVHLASPDSSDADLYPKITFVSAKVGKIKDKFFNLHGDLTFKAITNPLVLKSLYTENTVNLR